MDDFTGCVGKQVAVAAFDAGHGFLQAQPHGAQQGGGLGVAQGQSLVRIGGGGVVDVAVAAAVVVQVGLGQRVAGFKDLALPGGQGQAADVQATAEVHHTDVGEGEHALVAHGHGVIQLVAHRIGHSVQIALGDADQLLVDGQGGAHKQLDLFGVADRGCLQAVGGGGVFDVAVATAKAVQVGLCQGVAGQVSLAGTGGQGYASDAQASQGVVDADFVEGLVAGVADGDRVADDVVHSVHAAVAIAARDTQDGFVDGQAWFLLHGHRRIVAAGLGLVRVGGGDVEDVLARVDFGLCDGVAAGVGPGFAYAQQAVFRGGIVHQRQVVDEGVGDAHTGQGLVALVLHGDGVVDDFTSAVGGATVDARLLDDVELGLLLNRHRGVVAAGLGLVRVGGGDVEDVLARVDFGLCDGVAAGVGPGFAYAQQAVFRGGIVHQRQVVDEGVADAHAGQGLVALVLHANGVVDDFTGTVGGAAVDAGLLDDVELGLLRHRHRRIIAAGLGLVRVGGCDVEDALARVDFGLRDGVAAGVGPGFAHVQLAVC